MPSSSSAEDLPGLYTLGAPGPLLEHLRTRGWSELGARADLWLDLETLDAVQLRKAVRKVEKEQRIRIVPLGEHIQKRDADPWNESWRAYPAAYERAIAARGRGLARAPGLRPIQPSCPPSHGRAAHDPSQETLEPRHRRGGEPGRLRDIL